jgi:cobalt-zinc-cadmium efflux system membrane fusion protein
MNTSMLGKLTILSAALLALSPMRAAISPEEIANTVVLDETGEKNLKIETVEAEETDFEEIVFALGRIRVAPGHRAVVSSRVPGRILSVSAHIDTAMAKGAEVALIESRQPGDPPPSVKVTAPLGGIVSSVNIVPGQPVTPDDSLVEITDLSEVHATAAVPEHLVGRLSPGQTAHIRVMAVPGRSFEATLAHLGAAADAKSGTLEATFHIENPEGLLRPDMRAEFSIVLSKREGVMSVPRIALQGDVTSRTLYRRHYDNSLKHTFVRVPVQVGVMNDRFVEITAGLVAGDEVVTTGAYSLAFAGKGSVSLKAALDAAHGHEHNEDGSEISPGQKVKSAAQKGDDGHKQGGGFSMLTIFSLASNGLLLVLLVVATLRKPRADEAAAAKPERKPEEVQP